MTTRVSLRTLILMAELLIAVASLQYIALREPVRADAVWLAGGSVMPVSTPSGDINDPAGL